jgi:hypothetical protein
MNDTLNVDDINVSFDESRFIYHLNVLDFLSRTLLYCAFTWLFLFVGRHHDGGILVRGVHSVMQCVRFSNY